MRKVTWTFVFLLFSIPVFADVATLTFSEKTLLQGNPQTVTVTISKTLFGMTDVDLELEIRGPAHFEGRETTTKQHYDQIDKSQTDPFTLYLDDEYDGVTEEINVSYKLTYDTRTGPHIEKGQASFQGIWTEQGDCIRKLNLCRAAVESQKPSYEPTPSAGASTAWILVLCLLSLILGGFLGYKITHHFYPPKQQS